MFTQDTIRRLFVEKRDDEGRPYLGFNDLLDIAVSGVQEATQLWIAAIRHWRNQNIFPVESVYTGKDREKYAPDQIPDDKLVLTLRVIRGGAADLENVPVYDLLQRILPDFTRLCFVKKRTICDCGCGHHVYSIPFELLTYCAEHGEEATKQMMLKRVADAKAEQERKRREEQEGQLTPRLGEIQITDELRTQILKFAGNRTLKVVNANLAVVKDDRSEYGSSGGIGYWDQCRVFLGEQSQMKEWNWRDRYGADKDRPALGFQSIGEVKVTEADGKTTVEVELVNERYGNRKTTFVFEAPKPEAKPTLTEPEQASFTAKVGSEMERVMSRLDELHTHKPMMAPDTAGSGGRYVPYHQPRVKQREVRAEIGIAAFVVEEQIDHDVNDRQMRHELYVLRHGQDTAVQMAEDHGYTKREGGAFLVILEVGADKITINTKSGKREIAL